MTKIIELTKAKEDFQCIICCKNPAKTKFKINRLVQNDSITTIYICEACLAKMQREIEILD